MSVRAKTGVAWVVATAFVIGIVWIRTIAHGSIESLGDALTGVAAILAVAVATIQFESWKDRRREERNADIAGRALVAATVLKDCLLRVNRADRSEWFAAEDSSSGDVELAEALQSSLWKPEFVAPFKEAWIQVQAYLPDEIGEALGALWSLRSELDDRLDTARLLSGRSSSPAGSAWRRIQSEKCAIR